MSLVTPVMTAEEFCDFVHRSENEGRWLELVRGRVVEWPPPGRKHGVVCAILCWLLETFVRNRRFGYVTAAAGVVLERDPDTVRGPDVAVYEDAQSWDELHPKYGEVPPVLAVEVLSPDDKANKVNRKLGDYLKAGVGLVWLADPEERTVTVYRKGREPQLFEASEEVTGEDVLPGLAVKIADCFLIPGEPAGGGPAAPAGAG
jgi:Uma2 family endonuclease